MLRIELMTLLLVALAVPWSVTTGLEPETNTELALQSGDGDDDSSSASSANGDSDHHCVWFDKCGPDPDFNDNVHPLNCLYEGKAGKCLHQTT